MGRSQSGRIYSGRHPACRYQAPPDTVSLGGGTTGEACLPRANKWGGRNQAGFTPAVTQRAATKRLQTPCHSVGVPRGRPASPVLINGEVAIRPDLLRPSPSVPLPSASRHRVTRWGYHGGGLPPPC